MPIQSRKVELEEFMSVENGQSMHITVKDIKEMLESIPEHFVLIVEDKKADTFVVNRGIEAVEIK